MCTGDFHGTQGGWRLPRGTQLGVRRSQPGNVSDTLTSCPSLLPLTDALPTLALYPPSPQFPGDFRRQEPGDFDQLVLCTGSLHCVYWLTIHLARGS